MTRVYYTAAEDAVIRAHYPHVPSQQVADMLGRGLKSVYQRAKSLGVRKSAAFLASDASGRLSKLTTSGAHHRFQKGQTPMNKGVKHPKGWAPGRMATTQFAAGQAGWNWKPIGAERIIGGYRYTKVSDLRRVAWTINWRQTHLLNWSAVNGELPAGHALKCLDGDRMNVDASNWISVPRALLPRLNGKGRAKRIEYDKAPAEIKPTILAIARLEQAAHERKRKRAA